MIRYRTISSGMEIVNLEDWKRKGWQEYWTLRIYVEEF
jgi:hypothetical protein